jgi:acetyltransferase
MLTTTDLHDPLEAFFRPRGIALFGLSHDPGKLGYGLARNLKRTFRGALRLVHPAGGEWCGEPVFQTLDAVPDPVDLAVILLAAPRVPALVEECGRRGVRAAIVQSGGFREVGAAGAELERELEAARRRFGLRLLGPNCIGVIDTHVPLDTTFLHPPGPLAGPIGLVSHSGAACAAVIDYACREGFGFSRVVSLGNETDVAEDEALLSLAADEPTRAVALYLEGVKDGPAFVAAAALCAARKPVVALKVGRSGAGRRATASHTGALAGRDAAFDAALRRAGVLRASTLEELLDWTRALAALPPPRGRRTVVLTNAGGPGVMAADAAEAAGLLLEPLSEASRAALGALLPPAASLANPVDMLASAGPAEHARCAQALLDDPAVDALLVVFAPPPMFPAEDVAAALVPVITASDKPVGVCLAGGELALPGQRVFEQAGVCALPFPERAASALGALVRRAGRLDPAGAFPAAGGAPVCDARAVQALLEASVPGVLAPAAALALAAACGLRVVPSLVAPDADAAVAAAERVGLPVALKIAAAGVSHKSDVGGVALGLADAEAVRAAGARLRERLLAARPQARLEGFVVQPMVGGQEVIVGAVRDAQFGPLLMFGLGGKEVEGLGDVAFALAPLTSAEADELLARTWAGRRLEGFRDLPAADRDAVRRALAALGELLLRFPQIEEIEVNPLVVGPAGTGAWAVDVRARRS